MAGDRPSIERRHHPRAAIALDVTIGNVTYRTANISAGGFCLTEGRFAHGAEISARLDVGREGFNLSFPIKARAVFVEPRAGVTGFAFTGLDAELRQVIDAIVAAALRDGLV